MANIAVCGVPESYGFSPACAAAISKWFDNDVRLLISELFAAPQELAEICVDAGLSSSVDVSKPDDQGRRREFNSGVLNAIRERSERNKFFLYTSTFTNMGVQASKWL